MAALAWVLAYCCALTIKYIFLRGFHFLHMVFEQEDTSYAISKRRCVEINSESKKRGKIDSSIESGNFSKIPLELFQNILKFLSSEVRRRCLFSSYYVYFVCIHILVYLMCALSPSLSIYTHMFSCCMHCHVLALEAGRSV